MLFRSNNYKFKYQKSFKNCRDKNPLPFDFYLFDYNLIIEFDGEQHYVENDLFSTSLLEIQTHDDIKNKFCLENNINLLRIRYSELNKNTIIETIKNFLEKN